ncbi:MAG: hypothetical protein HY051_01710 [Candidatus Aenigmarchaeota archaeon]|nr:hypothetical protein [Candidatus Aenigmarchaeota archaeon]
MPIQTQLYVPIQGVELPIIPDVSLRGKNLYEAQLHAQNNGLAILGSPDINTVARAVRPKRPSKKFIGYAREKTDLGDKDVTDAYGQLHDQIWKQCWVRAREILVRQSPAYPRIISGEPDPRVRADLPFYSSLITPKMAELLGAPENTYVWTNADPQSDKGLKVLDWELCARGRPKLYSIWGLGSRNFCNGYLLGRKS